MFKLLVVNLALLRTDRVLFWHFMFLLLISINYWEKNKKYSIFPVTLVIFVVIDVVSSVSHKICKISLIGTCFLKTKI